MAQILLGHLLTIIVKEVFYDLVCDLILMSLSMSYIGIWMLGMDTGSDEDVCDFCIHPTSDRSVTKAANCR